MPRSAALRPAPQRRSAAFPLIAKRWEQEVPATLVVEVPNPDQPSERLELRKASVLPFLPRKYDELAVGRDGDYMTVDTVFWCPEDGITVWFLELEHAFLAPLLQKEHWKIA